MVLSKLIWTIYQPGPDGFITGPTSKTKGSHHPENSYDINRELRLYDGAFNPACKAEDPLVLAQNRQDLISLFLARIIDVKQVGVGNPNNCTRKFNVAEHLPRRDEEHIGLGLAAYVPFLIIDANNFALKVAGLEFEGGAAGRRSDGNRDVEVLDEFLRAGKERNRRPQFILQRFAPLDISRNGQGMSGKNERRWTAESCSAVHRVLRPSGI
ncbi:hypothetical protein FB451DRAFT_1484310 [Mycena latifolia]|nr:hypothetical protein FB451DRAFT_1484310 [Mycena latifolia]